MDFLLLNCGLHDIKLDAEDRQQVPPGEYETNLCAILSEVESTVQRVVWVRTTPVIDEIHNTRCEFRRRAADVAIYNEISDPIMLEARVPLIDLHGFTVNFLPDGFCDHVHCTGKVRMLQGAFIAGALLSLN